MSAHKSSVIGESSDLVVARGASGSRELCFVVCLLLSGLSFREAAKKKLGVRRESDSVRAFFASHHFFLGDQTEQQMKGKENVLEIDR